MQIGRNGRRRDRAAMGIGLHIARSLAQAGASVAITDIKGHEPAAAKFSEAGHALSSHKLDVPATLTGQL